jgi:perosamine synthetase
MLAQIQPWIDEEEVEWVRRGVASTFVTEHTLTRRFEELLRERTGARHAIAYCNATCGLFAALRAAGVGPGDEVIVPDLTFVATANAVILAGGTPVFCDVDPQTMMLDPAAAEGLIGRRTSAIVPVHLYGSAAPMEAILSLAGRHGLAVVEDAAQGMGVTLDGRHVGTMGRAGVISFYGNKTLTTGEGGVILTNDDAVAEACYRLKNHGRMEKGVFVHEEIGFNFSFTEMQAALGISQMGKLDRIIADKLRIRRHYERRLAGVEGVRFGQMPAGVRGVHWFTNIFHDEAEGLAAGLEAAGIQARRFFYPLHLQPCYRKLRPRPCVNSARLYRTGVSLPSSCGLEERVLDRVCEVISGQMAVA